MPNLLYAIICNDIIVDRETGSTSFIRSIEHAVVPQVPVQLPPLYVGSMWEMDPNEDFSVALQLVHPDGTIETLGVQEVKAPETMLHKLNFHLPGLAIKAEGRHTVSIALKRESEWDTVTELPFFIFLSPQQTTQA